MVDKGNHQKSEVTTGNGDVKGYFKKPLTYVAYRIVNVVS